jgi:hypothetical protein
MHADIKIHKALRRYATGQSVSEPFMARTRFDQWHICAVRVTATATL